MEDTSGENEAEFIGRMEVGPALQKTQQQVQRERLFTSELLRKKTKTNKQMSQLISPLAYLVYRCKTVTQCANTALIHLIGIGLLQMYQAKFGFCYFVIADL